ncbi:Nuclease PA3 [Cladophialophora carrionii]|uniref:Nuclease PA3 n=1 Tax=Cladophialophora carrionii TaxID=86049 RepID=A0A1C1C9W5_9EURO|nr:Nuclease PA3 [Cladophialophora carrionii]
MGSVATLLFVSLLSISRVLAWGEHGHRTVGYLSQMYFTAEAENLFNKLVQPNDDFDISDGAVWADTFATQSKMPWSKPWHYIDAKDEPPKKCKVNFNADCDSAKNCVVGAIANLTKQVNNPRLSAKDQSAALKFLLHFLGDITQPLHTEQKCRGGTRLMVQWGKPGSREEDLHQVWDKLIIQKLRDYKKPSGSDPDNEYDKKLSLKWAQELKRKLDGGTFDLSEECTDISKAQKCALTWASEANGYVCSYVLKDVGTNTGPDPCEECCEWDWQGPEDLSKEYYEGAVPIVEEQVAKAGWRLGQWINGLAEQRAQMEMASVVFGDDEVLQVQPKEEI